MPILTFSWGHSSSYQWVQVWIRTAKLEVMSSCFLCMCIQEIQNVLPPLDHTQVWKNHVWACLFHFVAITFFQCWSGFIFCTKQENIEIDQYELNFFVQSIVMMTLDLTESFIFQKAESLLALGLNGIFCLLLFANILPIQLKFLNNWLFLPF